MKRNVVMHSNDSGAVVIEGLGEYVPAAQVQSMQSQLDQLNAVVNELRSIFGIGSETPLFAITQNAGNAKRFSEYLHAIEHAFFMRPGDLDEDFPGEAPDPVCILNSWGSKNVDAYVEQFKKSLAQRDIEVLERAMDDAFTACDAAGTDSAEEYHAALCRHINDIRQEVEEEQDGDN